MTQDQIPKFERLSPEFKDFIALLPEIKKESERGGVLIACSSIDELLRKTLLSFFVEHKASNALLNGFNAPLGTFASRIAACYALGLIGEDEYQRYELLRRLRNRFAHHVHASLDEETVQKLLPNALPDVLKEEGEQELDLRGRFALAAFVLILRLLMRPQYVARERRNPRSWPL